MTNIQLQFNWTGIQAFSAQVGDLLYYTTPPVSQGGFDVTSSPVFFGTIESITTVGDSLLVNVTLPGNVDFPTFDAGAGDQGIYGTLNYVFFAKDNRVNMASALGYYSSVVLTNDSRAKAELFTTECVISESSK